VSVEVWDGQGAVRLGKLLGIRTLWIAAPSA
jgi:hypothetical protein